MPGLAAPQIAARQWLADHVMGCAPLSLLLMYAIKTMSEQGDHHIDHRSMIDSYPAHIGNAVAFHQSREGLSMAYLSQLHALGEGFASLLLSRWVGEVATPHSSLPVTSEVDLI
ncbi:hypothetical protein BJB45_15940 [Halomonas huangheensis]|uniref:Uncharacterized protein n=1 Tax=Halomonas huangheensis TaxID=1178482 RepID=W1NCV2_9GAMM|nr:hypothetical protein BJB45_15940 [Halomonas huangheensis]